MTFYKKAQPLAQKFFYDMLKLELQMMTKNFTLDTITQLIDFYGKAIEYYDSVKDPISSYFLEKLQMTLQSKDSIKLIIHSHRDKTMTPKADDQNLGFHNGNSDHNQKGQPKKKHRNPFFDYTNDSRSGSLSVDEMMTDEDEEETNNNSAKKFAKQVNKTDTQLKLERAKSAYRYIKILENNFSTQEMLTTYAERYFQYSLINDNIVRKDVAYQEESLRKKLEKRSREAKGFKNPDIMAIVVENEGTKVNLDELREKSQMIFQQTSTPKDIKENETAQELPQVEITIFNTPEKKPDGIPDTTTTSTNVTNGIINLQHTEAPAFTPDNENKNNDAIDEIKQKLMARKRLKKLESKLT